MKSITIRDVPEAICRELASRAAAKGHSLESYLKTALIELASRPDVGEVLSRIEKRQGVDRNETVGSGHYRPSRRGSPMTPVVDATWDDRLSRAPASTSYFAPCPPPSYR